MKYRWIALAAFCMVPALLAQSGLKPNFSGIWILNVQESKFELKDPPTAGTFTIQHREPEFHLTSTRTSRDGKQSAWSIDLVTDGEHLVVQQNGSYTEATRMYWDGDVLVLFEQDSALDGTTGTNVVRYGLSANGNVMTALEHDEYPGGQIINRWVFDKQADAK